MRSTLERPPVERRLAAPTRQVLSSKWAWLAILVSPLSCVFALGIGFSLGENSNWWGDLIVILLAVLPPAAAIAFGVRSGLTGNNLGTVAAALGTAWAAFLVMFNVGANYIWSGGSIVPPALLALAVAVVAAATEGFWVTRAAQRTARSGSG